MGFDEVFIDMICRIIASNWYSIIVIGVEVLSRSLNNLHNNPGYHGFVMEMRGPQVNHLSFVDDIILFTSGRHRTLKLIIETLTSYEETLGQLINRDKSHFMIHTSAFNSTRDRIKRVTGLR
ncbi:hypothetical protein RDI58_019795 [Solanum bulbocastanum]|uniref:Reverse transcriptase domain-containing protein n=1 Tax=Solanum bulbocastanum TaxID=147425 RepID=A0AAN8T8S8_SOLBU